MSKMWLGLAVCLSLFCFTNYYYGAAILIGSSIWTIKEGHWKGYMVILITIVFMAFNMYLIKGTLFAGNVTPIWTLTLFNRDIVFYHEGIIEASTRFFRIAPLMSFLFLVVSTTNIKDLGVAMVKSGLPYRISFMITSTFQVLQVLKKEMFQIMDAQKARGLQTTGSLSNRFKAFFPIIFPLVSNSIMKVQGQFVALETKGFNANVKKTNYRVLEFRLIDKMLYVMSALIAIASIANVVIRIIR